MVRRLIRLVALAAIVGAVLVPATTAGASPGDVTQAIHIEWVAHPKPCIRELTFVDALKVGGAPATADFRLIRSYDGGSPGCPGEFTDIFFAQGDLGSVHLGVTPDGQFGLIGASGTIQCPQPACPAANLPVGMFAFVHHNPEGPIGPNSAIANGIAFVGFRVTAFGPSDPEETAMSYSVEA